MPEGPFGNIEVNGPFSTELLEIEARPGAGSGFRSNEVELENEIRRKAPDSLQIDVVMAQQGEVVVKIRTDVGNVRVRVLEAIMDVLRDDIEGKLDGERTIVIF